MAHIRNKNLSVQLDRTSLFQFLNIVFDVDIYGHRLQYPFHSVLLTCVFLLPDTLGCILP
jgi:hypothetical protein